MDIKLKDFIYEFALEQERPKVNKYEVTEAIRNYARIGEQLRVNNNIMEAAKQFYFACENGTGWTNCQPYCHPDATFRSEAKTLQEVDNLNHYTEWMVEVHKHMTDISFDVEGFAFDEERKVVLIYGI